MILQAIKCDAVGQGRQRGILGQTAQFVVFLKVFLQVSTVVLDLTLDGNKSLTVCISDSAQQSQNSLAQIFTLDNTNLCAVQVLYATAGLSPHPKLWAWQQNAVKSLPCDLTRPLSVSLHKVTLNSSCSSNLQLMIQFKWSLKPTLNLETVLITVMQSKYCIHFQRQILSVCATFKSFNPPIFKEVKTQINKDTLKKQVLTHKVLP